MKSRKKKIFILSAAGVASALVLGTAIPFTVYGIRSSLIENDYTYLLNEHKIADVQIEGVPLVKQEVSCGYAIIEMLSGYYGDPVTEEELFSRNGKRVTTATTKGFVVEIKKTIPNVEYSSKQYLKNDELLLSINESLLEGKPVAVEWAAKLEDEWTLHWSIVTGMNQNAITIHNPYGYIEEITYQEFISRTTFKTFENMPVGYHFGFAYAFFGKNTVIL